MLTSANNSVAFAFPVPRVTSWSPTTERTAWPIEVDVPFSLVRRTGVQRFDGVERRTSFETMGVRNQAKFGPIVMFV